MKLEFKKPNSFRPWLHGSKSAKRKVVDLNRSVIWIILCDASDINLSFTYRHLQHLTKSDLSIGKKVFYPVVFSLYNPVIVYASMDGSPTIEQQLVRVI